MKRLAVVFVIALLASACAGRHPAGPTSGAAQRSERSPAAGADFAGRADRLAGNPGDPAATAVPDRGFLPRAGDYSQPQPRLGGLPLSFNTLQLVFPPGTTVGEANALLDEIDARIIGGIPGSAELPGILFLRVPTTNHQEMLDLLILLWQHPRVQHVARDAWFEDTRSPP